MQKQNKHLIHLKRKNEEEKEKVISCLGRTIPLKFPKIKDFDKVRRSVD